MVKGLVSTIIPVHNRPALLQEAVFSVLDQTYRPIEIVIVDDGSTDDTPRVAEALASKHPTEIRVLHQSNTGPGLAREAGRRAAAGEFIQYLDSDDILLPRKFEMQVAGLAGHPECGVSYGKTHYCVRGDERTGTPWKQTGEKISHVFPAMLKSRWWGTSTPLYRRSVAEQAGPWTGLSSEEDWEYDCRIGALGIALDYVPEFVSMEREHPGDRLSRSGTTNPRKLRDITVARGLILGHAMSAGLDAELPEMRHFARSLFLLSRQCGAAGLGKESRELFVLAKTASGARRARGMDFVLYGIAASIFGWTAVGKLACISDLWRH